MASDARCFDCLADFLWPNVQRFVVLKRIRDMPLRLDDPIEARFIDAMNFEQVFICGDCAGWYRDAIEVTE